MGTVFFVIQLLFDDLQDLHGTSLDTDAAGNALGSRVAFLQNHDLSGTNLDTLAAADTLLLVDHVDTGLGVLSDGLVLTNLSALTALDTGHRLSAITLCNNLNAGQILVEFLKEGLGASGNALQTSHTLSTLFNRKLLHKRKFSFNIIFLLHYTPNFFKYQWLFDNIFTGISQISCLSTQALEILLMKS